MARNIKGITVEIGGDTTGLQKALKDVNSHIRNTQSALKDVNKLLKLDPSNTNLLTQKQRLLKDAISETKTKLDTLKEAQAQAKKQLESGDLGQEKYDALQREIEETEQALKGLKDQADDFGNVFSQKMQVAGQKIQDVGGKIADVGMSMTTKVTAPVVAAGTVMAGKFAEVDKTMQLANKTMGNTEAEAKLLNDAMSDAAASSIYGMSDAATATLNFARAGLNAEQSASALAPAMNLAAGEGGNLDTVSSGLVATINGFHGSFEEAGRYADIFASACNNSALDVDSLSNSMSVAAPVFASAGYSVNDAALYMGVMANAGIDANVAANSLKTGLARLISPAKAGAEKLEELGISVTNADGTMKDSITIQSELHDAFAGLSESEQIAAASAIFGKNQMSNWLALINTAPDDVISLSADINGASFSIDNFADQLSSNGRSLDDMRERMEKLGVSGEDFDWFLKNSKGSAEIFAEGLLEASESGTSMQDVIDALGGDLDDLQGAMDNTVGTTEEMAETMMNGFGGSIEQLKSSLDVFMTNMGRLIGEALAPFIQKVQSVVDALNNMDDAQKKQIIRIAAIIAAIGPLLVVIGNALIFVGKITSAIGQIVPVVKKAKTALAGVKAAIAGLSAPVLIIVAVVGTLIAAFAHLWNTNKEFRDKMISIWNGLVGKVKGFIDKIAGHFEDLGINFDVTISGIKSLWEDFCSFLAPVFEGAFAVLSGIVGGALDAILLIVDVFIGFFTGNWEAFLGDVDDIFGDTWDKVCSFFKGVADTLSGILDDVKSFFVDGWNTVKDTVVNTAEGIYNSAVAKFEDIRSAISGTISGIVETVTGKFEAVRQGVTDKVIGTAEAVKNKFTEIRDGVASKSQDALTAARDTFESIRSGVADKVTGAASAVSGKFNEIKASVAGKAGEALASARDKFESIRSSISDKVTGAASAVSSKFSEIKSSISSKAGEALSSAKEKFESIRSSVSDKVSGAASAVSSKFSEIKSSISSKAGDALASVQSRFSSIKSTITDKLSSAASSAKDKFESLKNGIVDKMNAAKDKISGIVEKIKSFFKNMHLSIPKIKLPALPHFKLSGSFSLNPLSVPKLSVEWYDKAMKKGMFLDGPTIFGMSGSTLLAGGESGLETIVGTGSLLDMIRKTNGSGEAADAVRMLGQEVISLMRQYYPLMSKRQVVIGDEGSMAVNRRMYRASVADGRYM